MDDRDGFLFCVERERGGGDGPLKEESVQTVSGGTHKSPEGAADEEGTERGGEEESNSWCQKIPKPDAVRPLVPLALSRIERARERAGMCDR